jgi:Flagellar biosynthesis protein, FliO
MWGNRVPDGATSLSSHGLAEKGTGGLAGWLLRHFGATTRQKPRLAVLERVTLAPRQTLSMIEADGKRLLVATSPEGSAAFYPLDEPKTRTPPRPGARPRMARISW